MSSQADADTADVRAWWALPRPVRRLPVVKRRLPLLVSALALVVSGCTSGGDASEEQPLPTIDSARDAALPVRPGAFCDRIDGRAVEAAVGASAATAHYGNGDRAEIAPGVTDVAHEFGCVFTSADGAQVRAWVAVPPVTPRQARRIGPGKGCEVDGEGLGDPGFAARCTSRAGSTLVLAGLYTDTWFGCSLTVPETMATETPAESSATPSASEDETSPRSRLHTWCAAAVQAAATSD